MEIKGKHQYKVAIISYIALLFIGILLTVFINRFLGPSLKGEYTFLLNSITLFTMILNMGIYQSYLPFKRKKAENLNKLYINTFFLQFIVYFCSLTLISTIFNNYNISIILILAPLSNLVLQLSFLLLVDNPNLKHLSAVFNHFSFMLFLFFLFIFAERNDFSVITILIVKDIITLILFIFFFKIKPKPLKIDVNLLKESIKFGFFPMLTSILAFLSIRMDVFILDLFLQKSDIGIYSIGISLSSIALLLPDALKGVLFFKTSKGDSIEEIKFCIKISLYFSILILIGVIIIGRELIIILYGNEFIGAYLVTVILFTGNIPMIFNKVILTLFLAQGKKELIFYIMLISVLSGLGCMFILIPIYGIIGAALSNLFSNMISGILSFFYFTKYEDCNITDILIIKKRDLLYFLKEEKDE